MLPKEKEELIECIPHTGIYLKECDSCYHTTKADITIHYVKLKIFIKNK